MTAQSHFNFPEVVLSHSLGEVGVFCRVLLSVYSKTCTPIFIEIGSYLTNAEQKISFETQCRTKKKVLSERIKTKSEKTKTCKTTDESKTGTEKLKETNKTENQKNLMSRLGNRKACIC